MLSNTKSPGLSLLHSTNPDSVGGSTLHSKKFQVLHRFWLLRVPVHPHPMPPELQRCKPQSKPALYQQKLQETNPSQTGTPATLVKSIKTKACQENLTLNDWLTVFDFIDSHPDVPQECVAKHSKMRQEGTLEFTQSMLSWKLKKCTQLQERVNSHPNALSGKCPRTVTSPEVEKALVLWVRSMEGKGETVNGKMLGDGTSSMFRKSGDVREA